MYLDGCYHDNLPIDLALRMGATDIIAVDLHTTPAHANYANRPYVTYIKPSRSLGTMMNFDHELLMENAAMGYQDTMKIYGKYYGYIYTYTKESVASCKREVGKFISFLAGTDLYLTDDMPAKKLGKGDFNRLFTVLQEKSEGRPMTKEQYFVRAAELCGQLLGMDVGEVYDLRTFMEQVRDGLGQKEDYPEAGLLREKEGMELVAKLTELKIKCTGDYILGIIYYALKEKRGNVKRMAVLLLAVFPEELAAAYFLLSI